ncbi:MAG: hypothetical protein AAF590_11415 [Pseudomonadota bacterium]
MRVWPTFLVVGCLALTGCVQPTLIGEYTARISSNDRVNSQGDSLTTVAAILRQDRANFHRFGMAEAEDGDDPVFASQEERGRFERLIAKGQVSAETRRAILNASPLVRVQIFPNHVTVSLIDET